MKSCSTTWKTGSSTLNQELATCLIFWTPSVTRGPTKCCHHLMERTMHCEGSVFKKYKNATNSFAITTILCRMMRQNPFQFLPPRDSTTQFFIATWRFQKCLM